MTKKKTKVNLRLARALNWIGTLLIVVGLIFIYLTFGPALKNEVTYQLTQSQEVNDELTPPNTDFAVVIPKIAATAPVYANVDPYNKDAYLPVLYKGVAHAKGTSYPGNPGNTYLFAHSTDAFYNVGRYNAVFYLLGKLEKDDEIEVYYQSEKYTYKVDEVKVVPANAVDYLENDSEEKTLTLQTCYPPGTTFKRLVVVASQVEQD